MVAAHLCVPFHTLFKRRSYGEDFVTHSGIPGIDEMGSTWAKVANMSSSSTDIEHSILDVGDALQTKNHQEILLFLKEKQLELGDFVKNAQGHTQTLYKAILSQVTNGDKLISTILDKSVERGGDEDTNSPNSYLQINFSSLVSSKRPTTQVIKDMINFKSTATRALITHPVIQTFLTLKWRKRKKIFMLNFLIYLLFLIVYSCFLANIFYRKGRKPLGTINVSDLIVENNRIIFPSQLMFLSTTTTAPRSPPDLPTISEASTFRFCGKQNSLRCGLEISLAILIAILALQEILQFFTLGFRRYLSEFENWLEVSTLTCSILGLIYQKDVVLFKWFSAFGICIAYVVVIFLLGRYPMLGGSISLMFYTITKHLVKTLLSFLIMVFGFAFGFFIIHHGSGNDKFENFSKALFKTLVMAIGEFDFDDLYEAHDDPYTLAFTLFLLGFLIILVTLVLINLLVALIVSDLEELRSSAHIQGLINIAQHIVHSESAFCFWRRRHEDVLQVEVCVHSQCKCSYEKLEEHTTRQLEKIVEQRKWNQTQEANPKLAKVFFQLLTLLKAKTKMEEEDDAEIMELII